ncbi:MAG: peptide chain release factor N(5)-glutamine methyltransferase [Rhodospirillaceae bacterium]|nr:peptide chain release factor N(5)-glutamine methyltransferase [Rhodospirillaceae bacterium]
MTLGDILVAATARLKSAGVEGPRRDARVLVGHVLGLDTAAMILSPGRVLSVDEVADIEAVVVRREQREPVSRILGCRDFHGLPFALSPETLDPRPDSETVVDAALAFLDAVKTPRLLDLGTGSGCLLLALLAARGDAYGVGMDAAQGAVDAALRNAESLGLGARTQFLCRDWTDADWRNGLGIFDFVVSNPPYIPDADVAGLAPEVRDFDPLRALAGGVDGLDPYRLLIPELPSLLKPGGGAVFEVGLHQDVEVASLFQDGGFEVVEILRDLGGISRAVVARQSA